MEAPEPSEPQVGDPAADPITAPLAAVTLGPSADQLRAEIVRQVEFYFSDANIVTDDFLLTAIARGGAEGWVPVKTLASFARIKKLTRNLPTIVAALRTSTQLHVSPEGARVRRLAPLPTVDLDEVRRRSVIAWNLPSDKPTIEGVIELFSAAGNVAMARIRKPDHPEPLLTRGLAAEVAKGARDYYALVEYATEGEATAAAAALHDDSSWRTGLKVRRLAPLLPAAGAGGAAKGPKAAAKKKEVPAAPAVAGPGEERGAEGEAAGEAAAPAPAEERPRPAWATQKKKNKADYAAWASAGTAAAFDRAAAGEGGSGAGGESDGAHPGQPRMPNGGSGFGMGRGKPPQGSWAPPPPAPGSAADQAAPGGDADPES